MMVPNHLDSDTKKWILCPKTDFLTQKWLILDDLCQNLALALAQMPTVQCCQHKKVYFWCPVMMVSKKLNDDPKQFIYGPKTSFLTQKWDILGDLGHLWP